MKEFGLANSRRQAGKSKSETSSRGPTSRVRKIVPKSFPITDVGFFTAILVIVAGLQWCTLEKTDQTLKAQQRAWIEPGPPTIIGPVDFNENKIVNLNIHFRNIGKEPATRAVVQLDEPLLLVEPPKDGNWYGRLRGRNPACRRAAPNDNGIVIYPSSEMKTLSYFNLPLPNASLVYSQRQILVVEGCIGYTTIETTYFVGFCYYWNPVPEQPPARWPMVKCLTRNEAF